MSDGWPESRSYVIATLALWGFFLLAIAALSWGSGRGQWPAAALWGLALVLAGSVAGQFMMAYRLITAQDEFIRGLTAKRMIGAAGVTITVAVLWGTAEQFIGARDLPMWVVYPLFWGAFGIVTPFIGTSKP
jgi:hypothetical protein